MITKATGPSPTAKELIADETMRRDEQHSTYATNEITARLASNGILKSIPIPARTKETIDP